MPTSGAVIAVICTVSALNAAARASIAGSQSSYASPGFLDTAQYNAGQTNFVSNFGDGGFKRRAQERLSVRTFLGSMLEWRSTIYAQQSNWQFWLSSPPGLWGLKPTDEAEAFFQV